MSEGQTLSRLERKKRATLLRIAYAAFIELGDMDLDGLAIQKVMSRADFAFNTFYNYFDSRDHLMSVISNEIIVPWRQAFFDRQGVMDDPAVKLCFLMRLWVREFVRDERFARFVMRNGAFIHRVESVNNTDALEYFRAGQQQNLFTLPPIEAKYVSLGVLSASAALILKENRKADLAETIAERTLVMLGTPAGKAAQIAAMPMMEVESMEFVFQQRLASVLTRT